MPQWSWWRTTRRPSRGERFAESILQLANKMRRHIARVHIDQSYSANREEKPVATSKQKAAARKNIKKAGLAYVRNRFASKNAVSSSENE